MKSITGAIIVASSALAIAQPAIVTAAPKPFDTAGYNACAGEADGDWLANKISDQTYKELMRGCCYFAGGKWVADPTKSAGGYCQPPPKFGIEGPAVPSDVTTFTLQPDPPVIPRGVSRHDLTESP